MRRSVELQIITEAIQELVPGATPAFMTVQVAERYPHSVAIKNHWSGQPGDLAEYIATRLYGRPSSSEQSSPLAQADDAKRARDLIGEVGILMSAGADLESAPWYPVRPGDLVHVHYEAAGEMAAFGETYLVGDAGGLLGMQLLAHTCPGGEEDVSGMVGCFATEAHDDPLYDLWFEAGPHRLTIVRDGRPVHVGGAR